MHHNNINFTKSELQAFILLYVANADMHISDDEEKFIRKYIKWKDLLEVEKAFDKCNDAECLEIILKHKDEYFPSAESKERLIHEIVELIKVNDERNPMEEAVLMGLKRLL